jgi:hypothetical protein
VALIAEMMSLIKENKLKNFYFIWPCGFEAIRPPGLVASGPCGPNEVILTKTGGCYVFS